MSEDDDNYYNDDYDNDHNDDDDNDHDADDDKFTWKALVDPAIPIANTSDTLDGDDIEDKKIT